MLGNVWEWTSTPTRGKAKKTSANPRQFILKGNSFIDFREDKSYINHPARISSR